MSLFELIRESDVYGVIDWDIATNKRLTRRVQQEPLSLLSYLRAELGRHGGVNAGPIYFGEIYRLMSCLRRQLMNSDNSSENALITTYTSLTSKLERVMKCDRDTRALYSLALLDYPTQTMYRHKIASISVTQHVRLIYFADIIAKIEKLLTNSVSYSSYDFYVDVLSLVDCARLLYAATDRRHVVANEIEETLLMECLTSEEQCQYADLFEGRNVVTRRRKRLPKMGPNLVPSSSSLSSVSSTPLVDFVRDECAPLHMRNLFSSKVMNVDAMPSKRQREPSPEALPPTAKQHDDDSNTVASSNNVTYVENLLNLLADAASRLEPTDALTMHCGSISSLCKHEASLRSPSPTIAASSSMLTRREVSLLSRAVFHYGPSALDRRDIIGESLAAKIRRGNLS